MNEVKKNVVAFDFDGVIHKYRLGWGRGDVYDDFSIEVITKILALMREGHSVFVMSTRDAEQVKASIEAKLPQLTSRYPVEVIPPDQKFWNEKGKLGVCNHKVVFDVLVDDRAIRFNPNRMVTIDEIINFRPYTYPLEGGEGESVSITADSTNGPTSTVVSE